MPIYDYLCKGCGHKFEKLWKSYDLVAASVLECPSCHTSTVARLTTGVSLRSNSSQRLIGTTMPLRESTQDSQTALRFDPAKLNEMDHLCAYLRRELNPGTRRALALVLHQIGLSDSVVDACTGLTSSDYQDPVEQYREVGEDFMLGETPFNHATIEIGDEQEELQLPLFEVESSSLHTGDVEEAFSLLIATEVIASEATSVSMQSDDTLVVIPAQQSGGMAVATKTRELWQVREPTNIEDATAHEISLTLAGNEDWTLVGGSRRGKLHAHEGKYREDAFEIRVESGWHLAAVADGAGSARLSRVGSRVAVEASLKEIALRLGAESVMRDGQVDTEKVREAAVFAMGEATRALRNEAELRKTNVRELATTLLILAHKPLPGGDVVVTAQVGDGMIAAWGPETGATLMAKSEHGQFAGETQFLTHLPENADLYARVRLVKLASDLHYLMLMTDGVEDDFFPAEKELVRLTGALPGILPPAAEDPGRSLLALLEYEKRGSFDDRTLVLFVASRALQLQKKEV